MLLSGGIHALKQIQFYKYGAIKAVELRDKNASLELIGRNLGHWDDVTRHDRRGAWAVVNAVVGALMQFS